MDSTLKPFIHLIDLDAQQRLQVLARAQRAAMKLRDEQLLEHIDSAIEHDRRALDLAATWRNRSAATAPAPGTQGLDEQLAHLLYSMRDLATRARRRAEDTVEKQAAETVLAAVFPRGVAALTSQAYEQRLLSLDRLLSLCAGPLQREVATLGLERLLGRVRNLVTSYRQPTETAVDSNGFDRVKEAEQRGQDNLFALVALVLRRAADNTLRGAHDALLAALTPPAQSAAITTAPAPIAPIAPLAHRASRRTSRAALIRAA